MGSIPKTSTEQGTLLVTAIEEKARWIPHHTFMRYPTANWETDGYRTLTWSQYADAINKTAYWLDEKLGKSLGQDVVSYLGPSDLRYPLLVPAVVKTGRKLLVPDARITNEGIKRLLEETECKAWIYPQDDVNGPPKWLDASVKQIALPSVGKCADAAGQERYPYEKSWDEGKWDEIIIIHTSGTTGMPKPIYHTNGFYSAGHAQELSKKYWPRGINYDAWMHKAMLSSCPSQWLGGIFAFISGPIFQDTSCIIPPADAMDLPPTVFKKLLKLNIIDGLVSPPATIVRLYEDPETRSLLKSLQYITYLGAAMDQAIGNDLAEHTKLTSIIGSTEVNKQATLLPVDRKLWHTHDYVPEGGNRMVRVEGFGIAADGSDDLYEHVIERPPSGEPNLYQCAFWNPGFKGLNRIETKEMYAPLKDVDGRTRWVLTARKDDLTKLTWLHKFHAQDIEQRIQKHAGVSSVFVGGEGRPTPYVIVELKVDALGGKNAEAVLDELYEEVIARNNDGNLKEIYIPIETVFATDPAKPLKRSHKQTLMRKEIEKDYSAEIEEAYARLEKVKAEV